MNQEQIPKVTWEDGPEPEPDEDPFINFNPQMSTEISFLITVYNHIFGILQRYAVKLDYEEYTKEYNDKTDTYTINPWWIYPMEEESRKILMSFLPESVAKDCVIVEVDTIVDVIVQS